MTAFKNLIDRIAEGDWALLLPVIGAAILLVLTAAWITRRVVRIAKSEKPDEPLS